MRPVECPNKHFYDADKYDYCPHCREQGITPEPLNADAQKKKRRHLFDKKKPEVSPRQPSAPVRPPVFPVSLPSVKKIDSSASVDEEQPDDDRTMAMFDADAYAPAAPAAEAVPDDDRTMALFDADAYVSSEIGAQTEPVVGWLVALNGAYRGRSFPLKAGENTIGRSPDEQVPLPEQTDLVQNTHAVLTYDARTRQFYLRAENGGKVSINLAAVVDGVQIYSFDRILLGRTEFIFVALCGNRFSWNGNA